MHFWEKIKENWVIVLMISFVVVIGIVYMTFFNVKEEVLLLQNEQPSISTETEPSLPAASIDRLEKKILVDVKGAVNHPGVYELTDQSRVIDAIHIAGGTVIDADLNEVNQAAYLKDGQVVYIPKVNEEPSIWEKQSSNTSYSGIADNSLIDLNSATDAELQTLPGIGPSKAQAIITYREEHGVFEDVNDLLKVSGIGQKTLEKLLPLITVR